MGQAQEWRKLQKQLGNKVSSVWLGNTSEHSASGLACADSRHPGVLHPALNSVAEQNSCLSGEVVMLRITMVILPEQPRTHPQQCCSTADSTQRMRCFQQHSQVRVLAVEAFSPTVFMPRWALTSRGVVQCFAVVAETLGRLGV